MSYLGNQPSVGLFQKLDALTFNGSTTTFVLYSGGIPVTPGTANNLLISLNGVLQEPGSAFTVGGSTITFNTAPASGTPFFGVLLGSVGYVQTVNDGTITAAKLASGLIMQSVQVTAEATLGTVGNHYYLTNNTAQAAGTNLLYSSENLSDTSYWSFAGSSSASNVVVSPDGNTTADKLVENTATGSTHYLYQISQSISSGSPITFSVFVKAAERTQVVIRFLAIGAFTTTRYYYFTISTGSISGASGTQTNSSNYYGNGWYRLTLTATTDSTGPAYCSVFLASGGNNTYNGDGSSGVYIWGAQLEAGSSATSYMPSSSAQGTRSTGIVAPQRLVLPASPNGMDKIGCKPANNVATNIIDPNGNTIENVAGPFRINNDNFNAVLQYINGTWRFV